ncbi:MAG: N utilization substance protein B [Gammaproteobacteria bacterium RBG_16_57_12]|nr:MAG: N utilization substance protein B [Gammaproteobacteria bacterium RBG_16_57_12]
MSRARRNARRCAVQGLYQWQMTGQDVSLIEQQFVAEHDLSKTDIDYFKDLLHGVPLHLHELDDHMIPLLDRSIEMVDPVERAILRLGVYELEFRLDIPYRVVINEGVELAKTFGAEHGHKYVNSILDGIARKLRAVEVKARQQPQVNP